MKKWREEHKEEIKIYYKKWRLGHKEKMEIYFKQWQIEHREEKKEYTNLWRKENAEKVKENNRRESAKRRGFDCIPLNEYQDGYVGHHLDPKYVIYVPVEVHRSIYHSVLQNINMDEINALAMNYL